jgi:hypothetical protein
MPDASPSEVIYATEPALHAADFVDLLRRSTLAERRPGIAVHTPPH